MSTNDIKRMAREAADASADVRKFRHGSPGQLCIPDETAYAYIASEAARSAHSEAAYLLHYGPDDPGYAIYSYRLARSHRDALAARENVWATVNAHLPYRPLAIIGLPDQDQNGYSPEKR